jgi:SAM-dependent methyltransferase
MLVSRRLALAARLLNQRARLGCPTGGRATRVGMVTRDWDRRADELSAEAIASGDPTGWFDRLYSAGEAGEVSMPWERDEPHPLLQEWADSRPLDGSDKQAVVVGCGLGADAAFLARLGFDTVGFDISPTAVRLARQRHGAVDFRVADLLALPEEWRGAFDLVVEIFTLQALPDPPRTEAVTSVTGLVAPAGTLLAVAFRHVEGGPTGGPPFPLPRKTMQSLADHGLDVVRLEERDGPLWRAEYRRTEER